MKRGKYKKKKKKKSFLRRFPIKSIHCRKVHCYSLQCSFYEHLVALIARSRDYTACSSTQTRPTYKPLVLIL